MTARNLKISIALLIIAAALVGCVVSSVYPFYSPEDIVFDSSLLGKWNPINSEGNLEDTNEPIEFQALGKTGYLMSIKMASNETDWFETHLFEIQGKKFLDQSLFMTNRCFGFGFIPEHYICTVIIHTNTLQLAWLRQDWLEQMLKKDTNAIRHTVIYDSPGDPKGRIVLTAETEALQKFVLKHVGDTNAFYEIKYQKAKE